MLASIVVAVDVNAALHRRDDSKGEEKHNNLNDGGDDLLKVTLPGVEQHDEKLERTTVSYSPSEIIEARHDFPQHTPLNDVALVDIAELLEDPNSVVYQNFKSLLDNYATPHLSGPIQYPSSMYRDDFNGTRLRIMIQNPQLPVRHGTMVDLTPHILARQMHRAMISRGGSVRRRVSVCYRFEPKFVHTEYKHLRDSEYESLMYLFQRDNVDIGRGRRQSFMDVLMQELLELNKRHVSLCLEDEHVNHEFAHNSKCINFEAV